MDARREQTEKAVVHKEATKCKLCKSNGNDWFCLECCRKMTNHSSLRKHFCTACREVINMEMSEVWLSNKKSGQYFCDAACAYKFTLPKDVKSAAQAFLLSERAVSLSSTRKCKLCFTKLRPKQGEKEICHDCKKNNVEVLCPFCPDVRSIKNDNVRYFPCCVHSVEEEKTKMKLMRQGLSPREVEHALEDMRKERARKKAKEEEEKEISCYNCYESLPTMWKKNKRGEYLCNRCGIYEWRFGRPRPVAADGYFGVETLINPPCALCETHTTQNWLVDSGKRTVCSPCFMKNNLSLISDNEIWQMNLKDCKKRLKLDVEAAEIRELKELTTPKAKCTFSVKPKPVVVKKETDDIVLPKREPVVPILYLRSKKKDSLLKTPSEKPVSKKEPKATPSEEPKTDPKPQEVDETDNFEMVENEEEEKPEEAKGVVGTIASWMPFL
ncbi:hypothetical protein QR680_018459 [Steinernema hermaphroditum]|uniref:GATA-type domain-containing protein n=1 Tax=Steinernema hermaphroditum TaxID=289476 RepID=A0AA39HI13_9BILA|nr:hypothetical protein QR680_018459 [Steinernema hermaphroditum]